MAKSSAYEIDRNFVKFLEEEELVSKKEEIDLIIGKYRDIPGSLIPVLQNVQKIVKYLPVIVQDYIAKGLNLPSSYIYGVVSFYAFFTMVPRGDHIIRVCLGTACYVKGGKKIVNNFEKGLKIKSGETTDDRKFSLEVVRCLGACGLAPVVVIDENTYGQNDPSECMKLIEPFSD